MQCVSSVPVPDDTRCINGAQSCQNNTDAFNPEGTQRYFIPESAATRLNMLLANRQYILQVDVKIAPSGQHVLGDLYIDNVEWRGGPPVFGDLYIDGMRATLREIKDELRRRMHQPIPKQGTWIEQVVRGFLRLPRSADQRSCAESILLLRGAYLVAHAAAA